jgi:hypothetical protein
VKQFRLTAPKVKLVENDVEKACLDLLRLRGYYPVRLQSGLLKTPDGRWVRVGEPGLPDYIIVKHDFFLEVKAPGGKLSPAQVEKIFEIEKVRRISVATVDSVERLVEWLQKNRAGSGPASGS